MFVLSKAFGKIWVKVDLILLKNRNFCAHENNSNFWVLLSWLFLQGINKQIAHVVLIFQNLWSYSSIQSFYIAKDCSAFDRFCFLCVVCLFWWFYGFIWWVFATESWNTVDIMQEQNMNWFSTVLIVVISFLILTDLTKVLFEFCVIEVLKFWVILRWMKE